MLGPTTSKSLRSLVHQRRSAVAMDGTTHIDRVTFMRIVTARDGSIDTCAWIRPTSSVKSLRTRGESQDLRQGLVELCHRRCRHSRRPIGRVQQDDGRVLTLVQTALGDHAEGRLLVAATLRMPL